MNQKFGNSNSQQLKAQLGPGLTVIVAEPFPFFPLFLGESPIGGSGGARVCGLENRSEPETCGFDFKAIRVVPEKTETGRKVETREMGKWCVWRRLMKYTNSSRWGWIHYPTRVDIGSGCVRFGLRVGGVVG